ncbi:hypothetical protein [Candidatus Phytoplasma sp. AldY-WA1]|uniref:hypothetical protein n=1 Tax=Candidatus Phytoplasma sp. AldY-WA1 TaxID=2852100 RepID=UPI00254C71B5|nr:hypothetical protein [Candidatus Phytoplasma sp. AldY-WA1]
MKHLKNTKHLNYKKQQKSDQEIQTKLDNCFNDPREKNKYDLYQLLMKKNTVIKIINKSSLHAPRFIDVEDLK